MQHKKIGDGQAIPDSIIGRQKLVFYYEIGLGCHFTTNFAFKCIQNLHLWRCRLHTGFGVGCCRDELYRCAGRNLVMCLYEGETCCILIHVDLILSNNGLNTMGSVPSLEADAKLSYV